MLLQFTEHFEGTVPPGEGVSAILKAKLGHHYRVRYTAHQSRSLIQEFTAHQHNAVVEVWPCSVGPRVFALGCIRMRLALSYCWRIRIIVLLLCCLLRFAEPPLSEPLIFSVSSPSLGALVEINIGSPVGSTLSMVC